MLSFRTNVNVFEGERAYISSRLAQICWPSPEIVLCIMPNEGFVSWERDDALYRRTLVGAT